MSLKDKVAGKLYIIGEYNVLKSGHSALVAPVNLYIEGTLKQSERTIIITDNHKKTYLDEDKVPHNLINTVTTINLFHRYLEIVKITKKTFTITIKNNLKAPGKLKYGLGSSGASIILILKLLNRFYKTALDNLVLFKFSVLVQKELNVFSSGGDLAASLYDSPILYRRYDVDWLRDIPFSFDLLNLEWPLLEIKKQKYIPKFAIGWTKETFKPNISNKISDTFFSAAEELVEAYVKTFDEKLLTKYQALLTTLEESRPGIMTEKLKRLVATSKELGLTAKISGAGYGDSGIALIKRRKDKKNLREVWAKNDIMLLDIWRT